MKRLKSLLILLLCATTMMAGVKSPDGKLEATVTQDGGATFLTLTSNGKQLLRTQIGFTMSDEDFVKDLALVATNKTGIQTVSYTNIRGKQKNVSHQYGSESVLFMGSKGTPMTFEVRLFNDGLAFRYNITNNAGDELEFTGEQTTYFIPSDSHRWLQKYVTSYEGDFPYQEKADKQGAWGYPALFETDDSFILLTEANASRMYCATHLDNSASADAYRVSYPFAWEGRDKGAVNPTWKSSWASPWRVAIVGSLGDIVESTLVDDVSDAPSAALLESMGNDLSWIQPGRAAWVYWAYNHGTKDYKICCQYVDLAVEMGWEYVLFDWEWDSMTNGGKLEDAVAYALSKGIKPWIWYNSGGDHTWVQATPLNRMLTHENRVEEFTWLKKIGIVGVKVDFFESDKQNMMNYYLDILEDAVKFKMMVNFHGCTLPRGWSHTYPHLMSQEAVYGAEQYNNSPYMTGNGARINCLLPYTRNVVGPMDYTPVAFTNSQHPHESSFVHELALSVAFESGVQHWADRPEGFLTLPPLAKKHMQTVPAVWDETRFIQGYPGKSFVVARRSGKTWYVAGLNGEKEARTMIFPLNFLRKGSHLMTQFTDGTDAYQIITTQRKVKASQTQSITCLPQGGFLLVIE